MEAQNPISSIRNSKKLTEGLYKGCEELHNNLEKIIEKVKELVEIKKILAEKTEYYGHVIGLAYFVGAKHSEELQPVDEKMIEYLREKVSEGVRKGY